jgi:hypothetical protein
MGQAFVRLHERAAARSGKPRWADKNPENVLFLREWSSLLGEEWIFLHVVRNPLDTLASIKEANFPHAIPSGLHERIGFYRRYTQAGLDFGQAHPERYFQQRYEELVRSPRAALQELMKALGEELEPGQLEFNTFPQQRGLEDPKVAQTSGIHPQSIGRWPTLLGFEEAETIWSQTGEIWRRIEPNAQERLFLERG